MEDVWLASTSSILASSSSLPLNTRLLCPFAGNPSPIALPAGPSSLCVSQTQGLIDVHAAFITLGLVYSIRNLSLSPTLSHQATSVSQKPWQLPVIRKLVTIF